MDKSDSLNLFGSKSGFDMADILNPRKDSEQQSNMFPSAYSAQCPSSFSLFSGAVRPSFSGWETFREDVVSTRRLEFTSPPRPIKSKVECMSPTNQAITPTHMYTSPPRVIQPECMSPENQAFPTTQMNTSSNRMIHPKPECISPGIQAFSQPLLLTSPPSFIQPKCNTTAPNHVFLPTRWSPACQSAPSRAASHVSHQRADMMPQPMGRPFRRAQGFSGPPSVCVFCKTNGERLSQYGSHVLKDQSGRVTCPILRRYTCPICGASGDTAHTLKYCPMNNMVF